MSLLHPRVQPGKVILDGLPDDFQVHLEIAVCNRVAHLIGEGQGQLWVNCRELWEVVFDVVTGFADNLEVIPILDKNENNFAGCRSGFSRDAFWFRG